MGLPAFSVSIDHLADDAIVIAYELVHEGLDVVYLRNVHLHGYSGFHDPRAPNAQPARDATGVYLLGDGVALLFQGKPGLGPASYASPSPCYQPLGPRQSTRYRVRLPLPLLEWSPVVDDRARHPASTLTRRDEVAHLLVGIELVLAATAVTYAPDHPSIVERVKGGRTCAVLAQLALPVPLPIRALPDRAQAIATRDRVRTLCSSAVERIAEPMR